MTQKLTYIPFDPRRYLKFLRENDTIINSIMAPDEPKKLS